jgi:hypothetical protein
MPLTPTTHEVLASFEDISFVMLDGERTVRVDVPRNLLMAIARSGRGSAVGCKAVFETHRGDIERVASAKYDAGNFHSYANGCVVPVRPDDWARRGSTPPGGAGDGKV